MYDFIALYTVHYYGVQSHILLVTFFMSVAVVLKPPPGRTCSRATGAGDDQLDLLNSLENTVTL